MSDPFSDRFRVGASIVSARPVFTNRVDELARFRSAWDAHRASLDDLAALGREAPRTNVLHFYGTGGIGKSSLLHRLRREFDEDGIARASEVIDFDSPSVFDLEEMVLRLRACVGQLGIRCTAFDFALHFYWSVAHPGESIEMYTAKHGVLGRLSRKYDLAADMESSVMDIVSSVVESSSVVHGTTKLASAVHRLLIDRARVKHAIAECDDLPIFLDPTTAEQSIGYLPALLSWDLQQAGNPPVTVFWDTYEEVQDRGRRQEKPIQRICFLLPNVFFVVGGRNRLDWAHESLLGELDYVGPRCWPGLAETEAASQVRVGDLSERDSDTYLSERLLVHGEAAIPPAVRQQMVAASGGWPLYLDLAAQHFQQAMAEGTADDIQGDVPFSALATRLAADLSMEERAVMRGAALLESFDADLVRAAAGHVADGAVMGLLERDFVKRDVLRVWPLSLHSTLRRALRADTTSWDSWTDIDWNLAARRVFDRLAERAARSNDTRELRACLVQGLALAHEFLLPVDWLSVVARRLAGHGGLSGVRDLGSLKTPAGALSRLCQVVDAHSQTSFAEAAKPLDRALLDALSPVDRVWVRSLRATALLNAGEVRAAADAYSDIISDGVLPSDVAVHVHTMFALVLLKTGRFQELVALAEHPDSRVDLHRVLGDVTRYHARWDEARSHYERGLADSMASGDLGLERLYRAELALVDGWTGRSDPRLRKRPDDEDASAWGAVTHLVAQALFEAGREPVEAHRLLDEAAAAAGGYGVTEGRVDVAVARGFVAAVHDDGPGLERALRAVDDHVGDTGAHGFWVIVLRWWSQDDAMAESVDWISGNLAARDAWRATLERRRPSHGRRRSRPSDD
ncbi:hypothetical protein ASC64_06560 [Nocardioides sp. Root122]|uniref:hypothetical protein n=1 Tax=Nocardioides TaxID=1839 RepID=UPI000702C711|nr:MULTISPECIES: hypothetical protein [Nocardioides]KQV69504.1 hypothetical protein ASC64_06560 [Nocardioides sp. Root122]MCK9824281.1 hypothetical protein [Nocardioides cavernae]